MNWRSWPRSYWNWMRGGTGWKRWAIGIGGPLIALIVLITALSGGSEENADQAAAPTRVATARGVDLAPTATRSAPAAASTANDVLIPSPTPVKHFFCIANAYRIHPAIYRELKDTGCLTGPTKS